MAFGSDSWPLYPGSCDAVDAAAVEADVVVPDAALASAVEDISRILSPQCKTKALSWIGLTFLDTQYLKSVI